MNRLPSPSSGVAAGQRSPGAFRCLGCRSYVTGTAAGHCPRCGFVPPRALALPEARARFPLALAIALVFAVALRVIA